MNRIPLTPEIAEVAKRVIWFEEPQIAIADPIRFVAYTMTYGTYLDMAIIRRILPKRTSEMPLPTPHREYSTAAHGPIGT